MPTAATRRTSAVTLAALVLALVGACGPWASDDVAPTTSAPSPTVGPTATPAPTRTPGDTSTVGPTSTADPLSTAGTSAADAALLARALRDGVTVRSSGPSTGPVALRVLADAPARALDDGSVRVPLAAGTGAVVVVAPAPWRLDVLPDGTALVLRGEVPVAGVRTVPDGRLRTLARTEAGGARSDVAVLRAGDEPTSVWFTARAVLDVAWGEREGGRSLAVTPADWARGGGLAADALVPAQVVAAAPEAGAPTMLDQLACHQRGARRKDVWNIEPWRPRVSALELVATRCNPT